MQEPQERGVRSLGREDPLEEGIATHPSILDWRIPWTEEPGGLVCEVVRVRHDLVTKQHLFNPEKISCLKSTLKLI